MLTLYHGRTSVCSLKARLALAERNLDFDSKLLTLRGDQHDPAYLKLNPQAVVPTLVHDGNVIVESTVIMHYLNDHFPGAPLLPPDPLARVKVHMTNKLMDETVHPSCTVITFATANRVHLLKLKPEALEAELAKVPNKSQANAKRQVAQHGLDAPLVRDALRNLSTLLDTIEEAMTRGLWIAGADYSLADIAATPYVWRLDKLKLARLWDKRPGVAAWYERIRARPSFAKAVDPWLTPADAERYASAPDPWPKVLEIMQPA
jgi:glutathione S-transferase